MLTKVMLKRILKFNTKSLYLSAPTDGSLVPAGFPGGPPRLPGAAGRPVGALSILSFGAIIIDVGT